jgi:hypothetical protein
MGAVEKLPNLKSDSGLKDEDEGEKVYIIVNIEEVQNGYVMTVSDEDGEEQKYVYGDKKYLLADLDKLL